VDRNLTAWARGITAFPVWITGENFPISISPAATITHGLGDHRLFQQFELFYNQPYADKTLKHGFGMGFSYAALKEADVITVATNRGLSMPIRSPTQVNT